MVSVFCWFSFSRVYMPNALSPSEIQPLESVYQHFFTKGNSILRANAWPSFLFTENQELHSSIFAVENSDNLDIQSRS